MIIGFCGESKAGKDTSADFLLKYIKNSRKISFATPLKESLDALFGFTCDKDELDPYWKITKRDAYKTFGTDIIRDNLKLFLNIPDRNSEDFFIDRMKKELKVEEHETIIIPDVRFQNEIDFIKKNNGIIVKIKRDKLNTQEHKSERPDILVNIDYTIYNNGTLNELEEVMKKLFRGLERL